MDLRLDFHEATSGRGEVAEELADFHSLLRHQVPTDNGDELVNYFYRPTQTYRHTHGHLHGQMYGQTYRQTNGDLDTQSYQSESNDHNMITFQNGSSVNVDQLNPPQTGPGDHITNQSPDIGSPSDPHYAGDHISPPIQNGVGGGGADPLMPPTHSPLHHGGELTPTHGGQAGEEGLVTRVPESFTPRIPYYDDVHQNTSSVKAVGSPESYGHQPAFVVEPINGLGGFRKVDGQDGDRHKSKEDLKDVLLPYLPPTSATGYKSKNRKDPEDSEVTKMETSGKKKVATKRKKAKKSKKGRKLGVKKVRRHYRPIGKPSVRQTISKNSKVTYQVAEFLRRVLKR